MSTKKHIVCLGDSNTYGYCPDAAQCQSPYLRFSSEIRWPCQLQTLLGSDFQVYEEGLCGRTTAFPDPIREGLCALDYVVPCLLSHGPVSLMVVMLGTNDTKERFGASATVIAGGLERLLRKAQAVNACWKSGKPNILVVAPPPILPPMEHTDAMWDMGHGCIPKSEALALHYAATAKLTTCHFLDAKGCQINDVDYMHLTHHGHSQLAQRLADVIPTIV